MKPQLSTFIRCAFGLSLVVSLYSCQSLPSQLTTHEHSESEPGFAYVEATVAEVIPELKPIQVVHRFDVPIPCRPVKKPSQIQLIQWKQHQPDSSEKKAIESENVTTEIAPMPAVSVQPSPPLQFVNPLPTQYVGTSQDCLPTPAEMERMKTPEPSALELEVESLRKQIDENASMLQRFEKALTSSKKQIDELQSDVDYWKGEVTLLKQTMKQQHADDVRILTRLSDRLGQLVASGHEKTPVPEPVAAKQRRTQIK